MKGLLWATALMLVLGQSAACAPAPVSGQPLTPTAAATPTPGVTPPPQPTPTPTPPRLPTPQREPVIVVFHPDYLRVYANEAAAVPGRIESILKEIQGAPGFLFVQPERATEDDLKIVHPQAHIDAVKLHGMVLYDTALRAAGGAILASEIAMAGQPSFGLIRPPGHHAGPERYWGFCYFNNIAIAVKKLLDEGKIRRALIVDFDLHFGNGTHDIFFNDPRVTYFHVVSQGGNRTQLLQELEAFLSQTEGYDILAVSAGFDAGKLDLGGTFEIQDYTTMGTLLKRAAERDSGGKRFAILEGGYNNKVLGKNVKAFLDGFS